MVRIPDICRRTVLKSASAAAVGSIVGTAAGRENDHDSTEPPIASTPILAAHRGYRGLYPQNTIAAVQQAAYGGRSGQGYDTDMMECDLVPAGGKPWKGEDFEIVVFHDDKLDDLTDESGYVWETDVQTVLDAEIRDSGETIPRLDEFVEATPDSIPLNIEWKAAGVSPDDDASESSVETWDPFTEQALDVLSTHENDFIVQSFQKAALESVRNANADIPIAYLLWDSIEEGLSVVRDLDAEYIQPPYNMIMNTPFFNEDYYLEDPGFAEIDLVETAHEEGRKVIPYTITTWHQAEKLVEAGVDGIIADYPGVLD
ncbi:glycerophosphodiester phosphodiesterase [Haloarcula rubripromontorii]|uniref:glycerophosphodiester phosphodiesterase n=1 Tax=Haloarcula rubripromontorii TaxID=1705562 RepID=UPI001980EDAE|nr:glycerophosphodiester phosphodiesterase [Haloarcula rubripromontorii]